MITNIYYNKVPTKKKEGDSVVTVQDFFDLVGLF